VVSPFLYLDVHLGTLDDRCYGYCNGYVCDLQECDYESTGLKYQCGAGDPDVCLYVDCDGVRGVWVVGAVGVGVLLCESEGCEDREEEGTEECIW
jgi:hypothetical protein